MNKINIKNKMPKIKGKYRIVTYEAGTKNVLRKSDWISNLIMLNDNPSGLYIVLSRMIGNFVHDLEITKCKVGDDDTAPTIADTDLGNVLVDNIPPATKSRIADDEIMISFFINDSEMPDDEYKEFGIFAGNQIIARSIISPNYTKATGEDTEIQYTITCEATV